MFPTIPSSSSSQSLGSSRNDRNDNDSHYHLKFQKELESLQTALSGINSAKRVLASEVLKEDIEKLLSRFNELKKLLPLFPHLTQSDQTALQEFVNKFNRVGAEIGVMIHVTLEGLLDCNDSSNSNPSVELFHREFKLLQDELTSFKAWLHIYSEDVRKESIEKLNSRLRELKINLPLHLTQNDQTHLQEFENELNTLTTEIGETSDVTQKGSPLDPPKDIELLQNKREPFANIRRLCQPRR